MFALQGNCDEIAAPHGLGPLYSFRLPDLMTYAFAGGFGHPR